MKVFWQGAPQDATFFLPFKTEVARIYDLPSEEPISVKQISYLPDKKRWSEIVTQTLNAPHLSKAVLARCALLECKKKPDPFAIASHLQKKGVNSTVFCFETPNGAFLGASPEILFRRKGRAIESDILAGTLPRGKTEKEDLLLEQTLLSDPKLLREWEEVRLFFEEAFRTLCQGSVTLSPLHVRKTSHVQHLCATIQGTLKDNISDEEVLKLLHPTPAVCGTPRKDAQEWIAKQEPFERGLYASAIGWSTPQEAFYLVAIRSCWVQGTNVTLYTGAGIVKGSCPEKEWEELNCKMALYREIFLIEEEPFT